jgi:predicted transglutaminase-like cysteine proteinase
LHDGVPDCAAAETLLRIINDAEAHQGKALIGYVNRAINLLMRPAPGAWVGALEVLTFADGDCKDYSIAKFFALREAGVSPERLRLVIVHNRRRSEDHMVVAAFEEDAWFILDNATMVLATDSEDATRYIPLFLLDEAGVRRYQ